MDTSSYVFGVSENPILDSEVSSNPERGPSISDIGDDDVLIYVR